MTVTVINTCIYYLLPAFMCLPSLSLHRVTHVMHRGSSTSTHTRNHLILTDYEFLCNIRITNVDVAV